MALPDLAVSVLRRAVPTISRNSSLPVRPASLSAGHLRWSLVAPLPGSTKPSSRRYAARGGHHGHYGDHGQPACRRAGHRAVAPRLIGVAVRSFIARLLGSAAVYDLVQWIAGDDSVQRRLAAHLAAA